MGRRHIFWVIVLLYVVLFSGVWYIPLHITLAEEETINYTIRFNLSLEGTTPATYVFVQFRECTQDSDGKVTLLDVSPIDAIANTNRALNFDPFKDIYVVVQLPKNKKYIIEITPIADKTNPTIYQRQYYCLARSLDDGNLAVISTSGVIPNIRFSLEEGKKISGLITGSSGNISGIKVKLIDKNYQPVSRYAVSGGTGGYIIKGVTPGEYYLWADGASKGYSRKFYNSTGSTENFEEAELVVVPDEVASVSNKNISLSAGKSLSGKVLAKDGTAFQHYAEIYLIDDTHGLPIGMYIHDPNYSQMTEEQVLVRELIQYVVSGGTTDLAYCGYVSDGSYTIGGISINAVSDAILYASDPYLNYSEVYYDNSHFLSQATKIPLDAIQSRQFNLQFEESDLDLCPDDPTKTNPGICGCGVPDTDTDGDGTADCLDQCSDDPTKTNPGICGCGVPDTDTDGDGTADCLDQCSDDPTKTNPGICGCGVPDTDTDTDGDGFMACEECDDKDSTIYPNAPGTHKGKDNDCNGIVEEDEKQPSSQSPDFSPFVPWNWMLSLQANCCYPYSILSPNYYSLNQQAIFLSYQHVPSAFLYYPHQTWAYQDQWWSQYNQGLMNLYQNQIQFNQRELWNLIKNWIQFN